MSRENALFCNITIPNIDKYLEKINNAGNNIDEVCKKAINECLPIIEKDMIDGAKRHEDKGSVVKSITKINAESAMGYIYGSVGIDVETDEKAYHAIYQEFGDGHSPEFPDPFVRPAFDNNKTKIKKIQRDILKKGGIPVE